MRCAKSRRLNGYAPKNEQAVLQREVFMALHLILGNSGAGKSHYLYEHVLEEAAANPGRTYYVLVPEQFTVSTQREFEIGRAHV